MGRLVRSLSASNVSSLERREPLVGWGIHEPQRLAAAADTGEGLQRDPRPLQRLRHLGSSDIPLGQLVPGRPG